MTRKKHHWLQPKPYLWIRIGVGRVQHNERYGFWEAFLRLPDRNEKLSQTFLTAYAAKQELDRLAEKEARR